MKNLREIIWRLPLAVIGGSLGLYAFPTENIWILGLLIPAVISLSVMGAGFWLATLLGFVSGLAFYVSHIEWISLYLGPVPLIALATLQSLFFAPAVGAAALLYKKSAKLRYGSAIYAVGFASIWTLREWVANNFPYGGFPWSRLAMTAANSPMVNWVFWGGMSLLSFFVALCGAIIATEVKRLKRTKLKVSFISIGAFVSILLLPLLSPLASATEVSGELKVAAVQGNAKAGLFSREPRGTILENHIEATLSGVGDSAVDLIVWPENASDINPLGDASARAKIEDIANRYNSDFVFGTITERNGDVFNSTVLWDSKLGPADYYDKKRPVPFAEYVPDREFWRSLAPELIDLVPRGYSFGVRDGIYQLRNTVAGTLICFEIAEDDIPRDLATQGAELILSQTNNADFGYSDETWQQSAIAKLRAIETGRTVINISTVGHSAIYRFDGSIQAELPWYTAGAMVETVELRQGITPGSALGGWFDLINAIVGMSFIAFSLGYGRKR